MYALASSIRKHFDRFTFQNQVTSASTSTEMQLFVWNDRKWKYIDKNTEYDKKNYAVVRTLFVRLQKDVSRFEYFERVLINIV